MTDPTPTKPEQQVKAAMKRDFSRLYVAGFTTDWQAQRFVRSTEIDVMGIEALLDTLAQAEAKGYEQAYKEIAAAGLGHHPVIEWPCVCGENHPAEFPAVNQDTE